MSRLEIKEDLSKEYEMFVKKQTSQIEKIDNDSIIELMNAYFDNVIYAGNQLDMVKKHIYYTKPLKEINFEPSILEETIKITDKKTLNVLHAIMGCSTETSELIEAIQNHLIRGYDLDVTNIKEELGDLVFYMTLLISSLDLSLEDIINTNMQKLKARYKNGFTVQEALNRDLVNERFILEMKNNKARYISFKDEDSFNQFLIENPTLVNSNEILQFSVDFVYEINNDFKDNITYSRITTTKVIRISDIECLSQIASYIEDKFNDKYIVKNRQNLKEEEVLFFTTKDGSMINMCNIGDYINIENLQKFTETVEII